ncbi:hypothetical protein MLIT_37310 [Mycolicibacterium litorale]|uniref:Uncharacterized protein n=1 Tax=Mycolicibacterium litorale TaxID=758802 RepID=A0AAD1IN07_9MYCO|nr:hypothetical protein MLIT_37310 [Mycolicibacterium litorale]
MTVQGHGHAGRDHAAHQAELFVLSLRQIEEFDCGAEHVQHLTSGAFGEPGEEGVRAHRAMTASPASHPKPLEAPLIRTTCLIDVLTFRADRQH